ncbi:shikimate kinase [Companilactobacillus mishanensis]|nr:shikimate kinase [Companilactobacillus mishanensis]
MTNTIILIGFMGAGKTTVGQQLAKETKQQFLDLDDEFVKETGTSIKSFMADNGEKAFRTMETKVLEDRLQNSGVISTGGGIVESDINREIIAKSDATVIFLQADLATVISRLATDTERPLLRQLSMKQLMDRWALREPLYSSLADSTIQTNGKRPEKIVQEVIKLFSPDNALVSLRSEIDSLDHQIVHLISERLTVVKEIADVKKDTGLSVVQHGRMDQMRSELKKEFRDDENVSDRLIDEIVDLLTSTSINHENKMFG